MYGHRFAYVHRYPHLRMHKAFRKGIHLIRIGRMFVCFLAYTGIMVTWIQWKWGHIKGKTIGHPTYIHVVCVTENISVFFLITSQGTIIHTTFYMFQNQDTYSFSFEILFIFKDEDFSLWPCTYTYMSVSYKCIFQYIVFPHIRKIFFYFLIPFWVCVRVFPYRHSHAHCNIMFDHLCDAFHTQYILLLIHWDFNIAKTHTRMYVCTIKCWENK